MNSRTSAKIIEDYATQRSLSILDAMMELDHLVNQDWINTLPGAPSGYLRKTTLEQDQAISAFCKNRRQWIRDAQAMGLNLQGFTTL
jgi:hypothetical protein